MHIFTAHPGLASSASLGLLEDGAGLLLAENAQTVLGASAGAVLLALAALIGRYSLRWWEVKRTTDIKRLELQNQYALDRTAQRAQTRLDRRRLTADIAMARRREARVDAVIAGRTAPADAAIVQALLTWVPTGSPSSQADVASEGQQTTEPAGSQNLLDDAVLQSGRRSSDLRVIDSRLQRGQ